MKLANNIGTIDQENINSSNQFKITASAKAFSILADGIYSDKIAAVIRELSTNAADSHIEAGNPDKQFDVHLPSWNSETFFIRDYGVGLDKDEIENIYTTFFESTKTESNDVTGCLGLGSKTPFAYNTKSFTITSWKNNKKYIYSFFIDEYGIPSHTLLLEDDSTEPNGLKVELPVKSTDISSFETKAKYIYRFFTTKPNFVNKELVFDDMELLIDNPNYKMYNKDNIYYTTVVMGNVAYELKPSNDFFTNKENQVISSKFVLDFDIGSVDMDTSRERLSYTNKTVRRLKARFKIIIDDLFIQVQKQFDSCETLYEACIKYKELKYNFRHTGIINWSEIKWKRYKVSDGFNYRAKTSFKTFNSNSPSTGNSRDSLLYTNSELFFVGGCTYSNQRLKKFATDNYLNCHYFQTRADFDAFNVDSFIPEKLVRSTDSLPKPVIIKNKKVKAVVQQFCITQSYKVTEFWDQTEIDLSDTNIDGVFIEKILYTPKVNGEQYSPESLSKALTFIKNAGIDIPNIYSVRVSDLPKLNKYKRETFDDWFNKLDKKILTEYANKVLKAGAYIAVRNGFGYDAICTSLEELNLDSNHEIMKLINKRLEYRKISSKDINVPDIIGNFLGNTLDNFKVECLREEADTLGTKYPLIKNIFVDEENKKHIQLYVEAVDKTTL